MSNESGKKFDDGKLRYDLIPAYPLERLAEVYTIGCKKYADRNWEKGISWSRCFGAMMRHAWKFWAGNSIDPEGQHHLAAVVFYCFALMEYERTHNELDDRPKKYTTPGGVVAYFDPKSLNQYQIFLQPQNLPRRVPPNCSDSSLDDDPTGYKR